MGGTTEERPTKKKPNPGELSLPHRNRIAKRDTVCCTLLCLPWLYLLPWANPTTLPMLFFLFSTKLTPVVIPPMKPSRFFAACRSKRKFWCIEIGVSIAGVRTGDGGCDSTNTMSWGGGNHHSGAVRGFPLLLCIPMLFF